MAKKALSLEISTIVITAFALFLWVAVFTYHSQDSSLFTQSTEPVLNACGQVGSYLSSIFLQFFGLGSFLIPVGFLFVAAHSHSREGVARALSSLAGLSIGVISLTVFLSLHWRSWHWSGSEFLTGGVFGAWLSIPAEHYLNRTGASIVSMAIFLGSLVISTPIGVSHFLSNLIHAMGIVSYRFGRLAVTYFAYYSAIALNKLAQFIGLQAKKSFDQIKERAEAYRMARLEAKSALVHEVSANEVNAPETRTAKGATEAAMIAEVVHASGASAEEEVPAPPKAKRIAKLEAETDAVAPEKSVITVESLRKQSDFFDAGPVIEKAVTEPEVAKPKFKFDKKRGRWKLPIIDFL